MKKGFSLFGIAIAMLMLAACDNPKDEFLVGTVQEVRVVNELRLEHAGGSKSDDAAIGALVGALITGGIGGAIIGAAVGADGTPEIKTVDEPRACKFFANVPSDNQLVFVLDEIHWSYQVSACALLRTGDQVKIRKRFWDNKTSYYWMQADGLEANEVPGTLVQ